MQDAMAPRVGRHAVQAGVALPNATDRDEECRLSEVGRIGTQPTSRGIEAASGFPGTAQPNVGGLPFKAPYLKGTAVAKIRHDDDIPEVCDLR